MKKPELLLPVGTREMLEAAIQNGADAVYYGVPHWNARGRTEDFTIEDVEEMIRYARIRGVRTFLAMNILIFEQEIQIIPEFLEKIISIKPDAFIIQDIGLARLIKAIAPEQEIHASTQMTLASAEAVNLVSKLGFNRAVLARELSTKQIQSIKNACNLELEIFIHGALCVSYSGQCLTSENFGGRSANRGQCAQSCRLPYRIFKDGKEFKKNDIQYLFSPHDLCAIPKIPELEEIGIESLKVEGRLKSPEYVAAVAKAYRKILDRNDSIHKVQDVTESLISPQDREPLEVLFSRGLTTGWLNGINHQELVDGTFSNHHGEFLGEVSRIDKCCIFVDVQKNCSAPPQKGDGILFENSIFDVSVGGRLYNVSFRKLHTPKAPQLKLEFGRDFDFRKITVGMKVYRNDSPILEKELHKTFTNRELAKRIPVNMTLFGSIGEPLRLTVYDDNHKVQVTSDTLLEAKHATDPNTKESSNFQVNSTNTYDVIRKELAALSSTAYSLKSLDIQVSENAFISGKTLRALRQKSAIALDNARTTWKELYPSAIAGKKLLQSTSKESNCTNTNEQIRISVLVRRPEQIEPLCGLPIDSIIMDFDWGVKYDEPLEQIRNLGFKAGMASLRIHKPGENHYLKNILRLTPDFALVRSLGALAILKENGIPLHGDYSLNATNSLTYEWLLEQGLETLHPSWDLNSTQLFELLKNIKASHLELAIHQYMPAFHSEYCAFAKALTTGKHFPECDKICTKHKIEILDHKGDRHFLQSDAECRNTLFVGKPQSALKLYPRLFAVGVRNFRIELLDESPNLVRRKVQIYTQAIRGKIDIESAIQQVGVEEKYGISEGQLFNENSWTNRKKNL